MLPLTFLLAGRFNEVEPNLRRRKTVSTVSRRWRNGKLLFYLSSVCCFWFSLSAALGGPNHIFEVKAFGAQGNGKAMDRAALQGAIDAAHVNGGGVVLLPPGVYLTGSLRLTSGVELRLEPGATLRGSASQSDYERGRTLALLLAEDQRHLAITGGGTIDGQGRALAADVMRRMQAGEFANKAGRRTDRPDESQRPKLIAFENCRDVRLAEVTLRDSACWVQNYINCDNLLIEDVKVDSTAYWNNDGLDLCDCRNVVVRRCDINSADDGICLKSEPKGGGCEQITITNCRIRSSASALKFGTASHVGFRKIRVSNLIVYDTFRSAIALESVDGAVLEDVLVEHIQATNTGNALFLRLGRRNTNTPYGRIENVTIRDVKVWVPAGKPDAGYETEGPRARQPHNVLPSSIVGAPGHPIRNVVLEDIEVHHPGGGQTNIARLPKDSLDAVPEETEAYPEFSMFGELPAWGLYLRHVEGIRLAKVRVIRQRPDYRPALVFDDVLRPELERLEVWPQAEAPVINRPIGFQSRATP